LKERGIEARGKTKGKGFLNLERGVHFCLALRVSKKKKKLVKGKSFLNVKEREVQIDSHGKKKNPLSPSQKTGWIARERPALL